MKLNPLMVAYSYYDPLVYYYSVDKEVSLNESRTIHLDRVSEHIGRPIEKLGDLSDDELREVISKMETALCGRIEKWKHGRVQRNEKSY